MISSRMSLTDYLSLSPIDKESLNTNGGLTKLSDLIDHDYPWLLNNYNENSWRVSMPNRNYDPSKPTAVINIHFDSVVLGGGRLSDNQRLIDDMKLLTAITITAKFSNGIKLSSNSRVKVFVDSLKRYVSEAMAIQYIGKIEDLTHGEFFDLIRNASNKLAFNHKYDEILEDYFKRNKIADIPILRANRKKSPAKIDTNKIFSSLGINQYAFREFDKAKRVIALKSLELQKYYSEESFAVLYENALTEKNEKKMVHERSYKDYLGTLKAYSQAKVVFGKLFNYNLVPFDVDEILASTAYQYPDFNEMQDLVERTRDIPPMLFLNIMDAAARFVLDYADDLFEAEKHFVAIYNNELDSGQSVYTAGKRTNKQVKLYKRDDKRLHSPFPLAAFKLSMNREGNRKHSDELYETIAEKITNSLYQSKPHEKHGLTRHQYYAIRKSILVRDTKKLSLHKALYQYLPFSCAVIIFALTGRREMEVFGLEVGCVTKDLDGLLWLNSFVAKTMQRHADFSTVSLVERAVSILERLSEKGREKKKSNSIFVFDDKFNRPPTTMRTINHIANDFFDFIGIERDTNGEHWKLSEHQFRRFFAIMFYYRYENANASALMHELAHVDWSMTSHYLTEKETGAALRKLHQQYNQARSNRLVDYSLRDDLGGEGFPLLKERLEGTVLSMPEMMREIAIEAVEENNFTFDFIPSGLCLGSTPWLSERCNCYRDGFVMKHDASDELCNGCPAQVTVPEIAHGKVMPMKACAESSILKNLVRKAE